jgi:hypothetical protein
MTNANLTENDVHCGNMSYRLYRRQCPLQGRKYPFCSFYINRYKQCFYIGFIDWSIPQTERVLLSKCLRRSTQSWYWRIFQIWGVHQLWYLRVNTNVLLISTTNSTTQHKPTYMRKWCLDHFRRYFSIILKSDFTRNMDFETRNWQLVL